MRLDYVLYGIAIIFFIVTVTSFVVVSEQNGKNLWTVSTVVFGLLSVSAGYMLKPKSKAEIVATSTMTQEVTPEVPSEIPIAETSVVEKQKIEAISTAETPAVNVPSIETPAVETIAASTPVETPDSIAPSIEISTSKVKEASSIVTDLMRLTQVKGIGEKRAAQLNANGISSIEDLAKIDVAELATKLKISPKIVEKWVAGAKQLIK